MNISKTRGKKENGILKMKGSSEIECQIKHTLAQLAAGNSSGFKLYDKFKRNGSVQDHKKAMARATASVATDEAKERIDDFFAANHLLYALKLTAR
ncbi:hypothetical protein AVEN_264836-1 [Araneus ventricosus]|uniref:Uncharacterized protein n=1 Tax=Araneus ventricosus TaxID=182803 RepID=A0A4Y2E0I3_ARAVE|nr:hypothetical protein AVEN_264836-1 [Araneus ventricosus]